MKKGKLLKIIFAVTAAALLLVFALSACENNTDDDEKNVETEKYVTSVSVDGSTVPTGVFAGQLVTERIMLVVNYSDGTTDRHPLETEDVAVGSRNKLSTSGTHNITVVYEGCTAIFQITLLNPQSVQYTLTVNGGVPVEVDGVAVTETSDGGVFSARYDSGTTVVIDWIDESGKKFGYWESDGKTIDTQRRTTVILNADYTYTAVSENFVYTVNFITFEEDTNIASKTVTEIESASDITRLTADDYVFVGWTTTEIDRTQAYSGGNFELVPFPYSVESDVTFYAVWTPIGLSYTTYTDGSSSATGYQVVSYTGSLSELEIPSSHGGLPVLSVSKDAFTGDNVKNITKIIIPSTVVDIDEGTFRYCSSLVGFSVSSDSKKYSSESGVLYKSDKDILVAYPSGKVAALYTLEPNVTKICKYAFADAVVGVIEMSKDVSSIGDGAFDSVHIDYIDFSELAAEKLFKTASSVGASVFCDNLVNVFVSSETEETKYRANGVFSSLGDKLTCDEDILDTVKIYAYSDSVALLYRLIRNEDFDNSNRTAEIIGVSRSVKTISLPSAIASDANSFTVTSIGYYAFKGCFSLESVILPAKLERVCDCAFDDTPWTKSLDNGSIVANDVLYKYIGTEKKYKLAANIVRIAESAFANNGTVEFIDLSDNTALTTISALAFYGCEKLRSFDNTDSGSVLIKNNLEKIARCAFENSALKTVATQSNAGKLVSVGDYAFGNCRSLVSVSLTADGLADIGRLAFYKSYSLTSVTVSDSNDSYVSYGGVLYGKENGAAKILYYYPSGKLAAEFNPDSPVSGTVLNITAIGDYALCYPNIGALVIGSAVASIGRYAVIADSLSYVKFLSTPSAGITRASGFAYANADYFVFADGIDDENADAFFGNDENTESREKLFAAPCVFYASSDGKIIYSLASGILSAARSSRTETAVTVPDTVTINGTDYTTEKIGKYAFCGYYLTELTIESGVSELESHALSDAFGLKKLIVEGTGAADVPTVSADSFGENGKEIIIEVFCDPEAADGYLEKWKTVVETFGYYDTDGVSHTAAANIIFNKPFVALTYLDDNNVTRTAKIVYGEVQPSDLENLGAVKKGYKVGGWKDSDGNAVDLSGGYSVIYNTVLCASWVAETYTVEFTVPKDVTIGFKADKISENTDGSVIYRTTIVYGADYSFTVTDADAKTYVFNGWRYGGVSVSVSGAWTYVSEDGAAVSLTADRTKRNYTVLYDVSDASVIIGKTQETVHYGETYTFVVPQKTGYDFLGWAIVSDSEITVLTYGDGKLKVNWNLCSADTYTVTAQWKAKTLNVTLKFDADTVYKTVTVFYGASDYVFAVESSANYTDKPLNWFAGWEDGGNKVYTDDCGKAKIPWDAASDTVLYAIWPNEISTFSQLKSAVAESASCAIVLTADINVGEVIDAVYTGVFNGNGKIITVTEAVSGGYTGIFRENAGTIKNATVSASLSVTVADDAGNAFIGAVCGINSGKIDNIVLTVDSFAVAFTVVPDNGFAAGCVAGINSGTINGLTAVIENFGITKNGEPYEGPEFGTLVGNNTGVITGKCAYTTNTYGGTYSDGHFSSGDAVCGVNGGDADGVAFSNKNN